MIERFKGLFRQDVWWKVLAITLAVLLWATVMQDYNKEATVTLDLPLEVKQHPTYELFEGRQDRESMVEVRLSGPSLLVSSLTRSDLRAWVDYEQVTQIGRAQDVEVQVTLPSRIRGQVKYRVTPSTVSVTLVENRTTSVPLAVTPDSGVVALGDREFKYTAAPVVSSLPITGRSDYLGLVRSAVISLERQDLEPPLEDGKLVEKISRVRKPVRPVDAMGQPVEKLAQHYAEAAITWEELPPGKQVEIRAQTTGSLPAGFELGGITVNPGQITLRSATVGGALPDLSVIVTEPIDLTGQTRTFTTVARVVAPAGTSVAQTSVEVTVNINEVKMEKIFGALPIILRGQPANSEITLSVPTVQVRLTGPYSLMQPLDASAIEIYVELNNLVPGRHQVPVKASYPDQILEFAMDPAVIEVNITSAQ